MKTLETRRAALVACGLLLALAALAGCKKDEPGLAARFDYSVPERFAVPDPRMPDGQYEIYVDGELHPDQWRVYLNACASTGRPVSYAWTIDGALVGESPSCGPFEWDLPAEGTYSVTLVVEDAAGDTRELTKDVVIRDILMFGIGDSYGSGEGNPDVPLSIGAIERLEIARAEAEAAASALEALQPGALAGHAGAPRADTPEAAAARAALERAEAELAVAQGLATVEWQHRRCHHPGRRLSRCASRAAA